MRTVRTTLVSGLVATTLLLVPLTGAIAHEGTMASHPVVGAWIVDAEPSNPGVNLHTSVFYADGTTTDSSPGSSGAGVWVPTGEHTADVSFVEIVADEDGRQATITINTSLEVSEDGQSWSGLNSVHFSPEMTEYFGAPEGEFGPLAVNATRINLEPMDPDGPMPGGE